MPSRFRTLTRFISFVLAASVQALCQVPSFTISTIAGSGTSGYSGDGGPATAASLNNPRGIVSDPAGNVYFCDFSNNRVRKIATDGTITTVAGTGVAGYNGDNMPGTSARLNQPYRLALDPAGNLYIADPGNNRIRKLAPNGIITTVAGNGNANYSGDGGPATSAALNYAEDAVLDVSGNIYIADSANNVVRKVAINGTITTVAGNGVGAGTQVGAYSGDGGPATKASLSNPVSLAVDPSGNIFISDQANNVVRKVDTSGIITTFAGTGAFGFTGDGGPAVRAQFGFPAGVALDAANNLYVDDVNNNRIRVVLSDGTIQTVAGDGAAGFGGDGGPATSGALNNPRSVAVGTFGDIYVADFANSRVRKLTPGATTVGQTTNAFGNIRVMAANTWVIIKGENLAPPGDSRTWQSSDFVNNQLPTALDGVSVSMNGLKAYVYYISPQQVNVLAPPSLQPGLVQIQVTNNGKTSAPAFIVVQPISPTFFEFNGGPYVTAVHSNGSLLGPATLYPGSSTPAQAGETILLFANGFGPTSATVTGGSLQQSGTLPSTPVVTIGGIPATVTFAGLISPGLYQFNVVVPASAPSGDNALVATYNGQSTQADVLLTIR
ncbi:MAG TPA: IPT/TIG domain-containing protein [Bryobacteraceae bacterium]|nr:IPT/TIG domain-containing protein [Bryobacteraceae bacterium]